MQFVVLAFDSEDPDAYERRKQARRDHSTGVKRLKADGCFRDGGALLNSDGKTIGSVLLLDFANRDVLDRYLSSDPYMIRKVWADIKIYNAGFFEG